MSDRLPELARWRKPKRSEEVKHRLLVNSGEFAQRRIIVIILNQQGFTISV